MATLHEYPVGVSWSGGRDGHGSVLNDHSKTKIDLAVPVEFQGAGGASNPEELLTSAIASCYTITFGIVAANRKLPIQSVEVSATGVVEQNGAALVYRQITIKPKITVTAEATEDQVTSTKDMAHRADSYCIITNAVRGKVEVIVDPEILRAS